jgi:hypothetical protein
MGTAMRGLRFNLSTMLVAVLFAAFDSWCLVDSGRVTEGGLLGHRHQCLGRRWILPNRREQKRDIGPQLVCLIRLTVLL